MQFLLGGLLVDYLYGVEGVPLQFEFAGVHADVVVVGIQVADVGLPPYRALVGISVVDIRGYFLMVGQL